MLRVTLEVVPFGDETQKRTLETLHITNVFGDENVADYRVVLIPKTGAVLEGRVDRFQRKLSAWALVRRALEVMGR